MSNIYLINKYIYIILFFKKITLYMMFNIEYSTISIGKKTFFKNINIRYKNDINIENTNK